MHVCVCIKARKREISNCHQLWCVNHLETVVWCHVQLICILSPANRYCTVGYVEFLYLKKSFADSYKIINKVECFTVGTRSPMVSLWVHVTSLYEGGEDSNYGTSSIMDMTAWQDPKSMGWWRWHSVPGIYWIICSSSELNPMEDDCIDLIDSYLCMHANIETTTG